MKIGLIFLFFALSVHAQSSRNIGLKIKAQEVTIIQQSQILSGGSIDGGGGNAVVCFKDKRTAHRVRKTHQVRNGDLDQVTLVKILDLVQIENWVEQNPEDEMIRLKEDESIKDFVTRFDRRLSWMIPGLGGYSNSDYPSPFMRRALKDHKGLIFHLDKDPQVFRDLDKEGKFIDFLGPLPFSNDIGEQI